MNIEEDEREWVDDGGMVIFDGSYRRAFLIPLYSAELLAAAIELEDYLILERYFGDFDEIVELIDMEWGLVVIVDYLVERHEVFTVGHRYSG